MDFRSLFLCLIACFIDKNKDPEFDRVPVHDMVSEFDEIEEEEKSQPMSASQESYRPSQSQTTSSEASSSFDEVLAF